MAGPEQRKQQFNAWHTLTDPTADFAGTVSLPVLTGSMAPLVPVGALLEIASARRHAFGVGHVVVFARGQRLVAHRLVFALGFGRHVLYLEKGDRNESVGFVRRRDVCGVATGWRPRDGHAGDLVPLSRSRRLALRSLLRGIRAGLRRLLRPEPGRGSDEPES